MNTLIGKSVCSGIAIGRVEIYKRNAQMIKREKVEDAHAETERYVEARNKAIDELEHLFYKATREIGEAEAQIFSIHKMMLEDIDYNESVVNIIEKQMVNAETAVLLTADSLAKMFSETEDTYMTARAGDVRDVSDRIINILSGERTKMPESSENTIIFADDLAPSETLQMDKTKITAFVTEKGSASSHTAILARSMGIPAVIGIKISDEMDGQAVAVDGFTGIVYLDPNEEVLNKLREKSRERDRQRELLELMKNRPTETKNGRKVKLYANIGTPNEVGSAVFNDAEGIGLMRSEFLYLESRDFPSEESQFDAYKRVLEGMNGKMVIIRTLDIGADKKIDYFNLPKEENPAMGLRAIRICLTRKDIFKTQLRAILRASIFGNVSIMFPMIVSVEEVKKAKAILEEAKAELREKGIAYEYDIPVGIMIETPASAVISDELAKEVDFFSIGTNDLTQYVLAMDRQNMAVADMVDTHHKAILRMINVVINNAHKAGIWAGICGELGSDTSIIPELLKMGVDELSVSPNKVLEIRKIIREYEE